MNVGQIQFSGLFGFDLDYSESPIWKTVRRVVDAIENFFDYTRVQASFVGTGVVGIITSAVLLNPVIRNFTGHCLEELNDSSADLDECKEPYASNMKTYLIVIGIGSTIIGFALQKWWEPNSPREYEELASQRAYEASWTTTCFHNFKHIIACAQRDYTFEAQLFLGFVYTGLWINTESRTSWEVYYNMQAAAVGMAFSCLGMYGRTLWLALRDVVDDHRTHVFDVEDHEITRTTCLPWTKRAFYLCSGVTAVTISGTQYPRDTLAYQLVQGLGLMLIGRSISEPIILGVQRCRRAAKTAKSKEIAALVSGILRWIPTPCTLMSYFIYLNENWFAGAILIGISQGIREGYHVHSDSIVPFRDYRYENFVDPSTSTCRRIAGKASSYILDYYQTAVIISACVVFKSTNLANCYNSESYNCPISFELSGNYVNIDGAGVTISLVTGFTTFYFRKVLRKIYEHFNQTSVKTISKYTIHLMDTHQFDILTLIPFMVANSGQQYNPSFDGYVCHNPINLLVLLGFALGNHKENIKTFSGAQDEEEMGELFGDPDISARAVGL